MMDMTGELTALTTVKEPSIGALMDLICDDMTFRVREFPVVAEKSGYKTPPSVPAVAVLIVIPLNSTIWLLA